MKRLVLPIVFLSLICCTNEEFEEINYDNATPTLFCHDKGDTISILAIGNSFSCDAITYLPAIANDRGVGIIIGNLNIGGCSLEKHLAFLTKNSAVYGYQKCTNDNSYYITTQRPNVGLFDEMWDIVSLQQSSPLSGLYESYVPYAQLLKDTICSMLNYTPEFAWHQTWAYAKNSLHEGFAHYGNSQDSMYHCIVNSSQRIADELDTEFFFPVGTALQYFRNIVGKDSVCSDGYHLNELGRYIAGCVWYECLFGEDANTIEFYPTEHITEEEARIAREVAHKAVIFPNGSLLYENSPTINNITFIVN